MKKIKVLDFYTTTCGPCRLLAPIIQEVTTTLGIELVKIDASQSPETNKYGITGVPTLVVLDQDNNEITRHVGLLPKKTLTEWLNGLRGLNQ